MRGKQWIEQFIIQTPKLYDKYTRTMPESWYSPGEWTKFLYKIMNIIGDELNCEVVHKLNNKKRNPKNEGKVRKEYLNIDVTFYDATEYKSAIKGYHSDPLVLPVALLELENSYNIDKISSCLYKLLRNITSIRVLICYQTSKVKRNKLISHLEKVIHDGDLTKYVGNTDTYVVVGNDDNKNDVETWNAYYSIYELIGKKFEKIEELKWYEE